MCAGSKRKDSLRVVFVINADFEEWLGGINYFKTLIDAIVELPDSRVMPVIFTGLGNERKVRELFPDVEVIASSLLDAWTPGWVLRNLFKRIFFKDFLLGRFFSKHRIDLLSHAGLSVSRSGIPTLCWIPDFQHIHLPRFFSSNEIAKRNRRFLQLCKMADGVIVSSQDAQKDLRNFYPQAAGNSFVLNFVPTPGTGFEHISMQDLQEKYQVTHPYFHLPNQFWAHKNHQLVIDALRNLKAAGKDFLVVATGNTTDLRNPGFYDALMKQAADDGLFKNFRALGIVPYKDLMALMRYSVAVINPSLFEGWSTTVEEAKSMGKKVILSDIPVHREQNPERGIFVNPNDPEHLARALKTAVQEFDAETERQCAEKAKRELSDRRRAFARRYQEIVLAVLRQQNDNS